MHLRASLAQPGVLPFSVLQKSSIRSYRWLCTLKPHCMPSIEAAGEGKDSQRGVGDDLVNEHDDNGCHHPAVLGQHAIHIVCTQPTPSISKGLNAPLMYRLGSPQLDPKWSQTSGIYTQADMTPRLYCG